MKNFFRIATLALIAFCGINLFIYAINGNSAMATLWGTLTIFNYLSAIHNDYLNS